MQVVARLHIFRRFWRKKKTCDLQPTTYNYNLFNVSLQSKIFYTNPTSSSLRQPATAIGRGCSFYREGTQPTLMSERALLLWTVLWTARQCCGGRSFGWLIAKEDRRKVLDAASKRVLLKTRCRSVQCSERGLRADTCLHHAPVDFTICRVGILAHALPRHQKVGKRVEAKTPRGRVRAALGRRAEEAK